MLLTKTAEASVLEELHLNKMDLREVCPDIMTKAVLRLKKLRIDTSDLIADQLTGIFEGSSTVG